MAGYFFLIYFSMCDLVYNKLLAIIRRMSYNTSKITDWNYTKKVKRKKREIFLYNLL
jgi:hypothetical protein